MSASTVEDDKEAKAMNNFEEDIKSKEEFVWKSTEKLQFLGERVIHEAWQQLVLLQKEDGGGSIAMDIRPPLDTSTIHWWTLDEEIM